MYALISITNVVKDLRLKHHKNSMANHSSLYSSVVKEAKLVVSGIGSR